VADKVTNLPQEKKQVEPPKQQTHTGELLAKHNNTVNAPIKNSAPKDIGDTIVSLNCSDAKLNEVLDQLTELSKANLVLLSPSESRITLRLKNVKLSEMLRHITSMTGLTYLKSNNAYLIATAEKLKSAYPVEYAATYPETDTSTQVTTQDQPDPVVTKIYTTRYVDSTQLANALKGMFDNQITAVAGPAQMSLSLDQVDTSAATGVAAGSLSNGQAVARAGRKVILRGPSGAVEAALEAANALDQESAQVAIAVKIHDVSNDALRELGISWQWSNVTISEGDARGMNFGSFTRSPLAFNAQIKALEQENRAKLLAEPSIAVLDNEQAYILVGSRLTYPVVIGFTQANTPIFNREEARVGIYLQVAPSIGANDQITMSLKPQVSVVKGYIEVNGGSYPQIDTREAQTTLRVRSGDTIVMGGLIRDEDINQVERVPFLSQIPLLGELFKRRKSTKISSQVIITITPTIIRPTE
jgi:type II secretory pathway component GspD/PulD (secretin)